MTTYGVRKNGFWSIKVVVTEGDQQFIGRGLRTNLSEAINLATMKAKLQAFCWKDQQVKA